MNRDKKKTCFALLIGIAAFVLTAIAACGYIYYYYVTLDVDACSIYPMLLAALLIAAAAYGLWVKLLGSRTTEDVMPVSPRSEKLLTTIVAALTILAAVLPMGINPFWNGEIPAHRNQYELMAEAILDGHLYLDYDHSDAKLAALENPYDPNEREEAELEAGVDYHWDHAYYNGHFYMYFGIVPTLLIFLPFRVITGVSLTTYHATQIFTAFFIVGVFLLFRLLAHRFFRALPLFCRLLMSAAFSAVSIWYVVTSPSLYCTAIVSAMCLEIWSLYFFLRAVYVESVERREIIMAFFGALFGALSFGCRPPVALANLLVLPLLVVYLKRKKPIRPALVGKLALAALPYIVIGVLLMLYNYVRFDNPFEFGQSYQLTVADQRLYAHPFANFNVIHLIKQTGVALAYPFSLFPGLFLEYPVFLFLLFLFERRTRQYLTGHDLYAFLWAIIVTMALILVLQTLTSPYLLERYKTDYLWMLSIGCFSVVAAIACSRPEHNTWLHAANYLSMAALLVSTALFFWPNDLSLETLSALLGVSF